MKRTFLAAALMIIGGAIASAETLTANIPFTFHVPGAQLPAGKYVMTRADYPSFDAYFFRKADQAQSRLVTAPIRQSNKGFKVSQLTFRCVGDECELASIQSAAQGTRNGVISSLKNVSGTEISMRVVEITTAD